MRKFIVQADNIGGKGNKVYKKGTEITEDCLYEGQVDKFVLSGFLTEVGIEAPVIRTKNHPVIVIDCLKGKNSVFESITRAVKKDVEGDKSLNNCVIIIGYNNAHFSQFKSQYPHSKIIIYQLEQISSEGNPWWCTNHHGSIVRDWIKNCDEIWEYCIENIHFLRKSGVPDRKLKYKPIGYSDEFIVNDYDVLFYGFLNKHRLKLLKKAAEKYRVCIIGVVSHECGDMKEFSNLKITPPKYGEDLWGYIKRSKVVLNIHYYEIQETVRMSELLANGVQVLSESSKINYYNGLVEEFKDEQEMMKKLARMIKSPAASKVNSFKKLKFPQPDPAEDRSITVYTSFTEGYDDPRTDVTFIEAKSKYPNPAKDAGVVKWRYWDHGVDTKFNMWVDGSIYPLNDFDEYIDLMEGADICLFKHPWRDCIYDEAVETLRLDFDLASIANPQMKRYQKEGYPAHNGLGETGVMIRRDIPIVREFCAALWDEIEKGSHRDQLAFNYVLSKFPKLKVNYMPPSVRNHPMFKMVSHKKHMHAKDGKLEALKV